MKIELSIWLSYVLLLTLEQRAVARRVEQATREYFRRKLDRLGLPDDSLMDLPEVHYTHPEEKSKNGQKENGYYSVDNNIVVVFANLKIRDFFDVLGYVPHETSHASVSKEILFNFRGDKAENFTKTTAIGMEFIEAGKTMASGIEEGMVYFDQVDFFHTNMRTLFPKDYNRRKRWTTTDKSGRRKWIDATFLERDYDAAVDSSLYGSFNSQHVLPFVNFDGISLLRKVIPPSLSIDQLKEYLFIRKLCELVGRNTSGTFDPEIDTETAVNTGRDILDKDRYLRTGDASQQIIAILGEENAQKVFQLKDHDDDNIDDAMRVLTTVQSQRSSTTS